MTETTQLTPALYLIPVTLGEAPHHRILPSWNADVVRAIRHFVVEDLRSARRFLKQVDRTIDIDRLTFYEMGKHADEARFATYLAPLERGESVGVLSEAGCPAVADPGAILVGIAQRKRLKVVPLVGPSSILLALMGSGFNGQSFAFHGYLPIEPAQRSKVLRHLETQAISADQTQLFIETPYRNAKLLEEVLRTLRPTTRFCIAAGLTTEQEYLCTRTVKEWKTYGYPELGKVPAIFLIYR
ncbi:MAG: SAM-dependent methyltransferase [Bacteroidales bacterium]|nr:SAM-dependent methyltransferase [Bacteroidales bacterium]